METWNYWIILWNNYNIMSSWTKSLCCDRNIRLHSQTITWRFFVELKNYLISLVLYWKRRCWASTAENSCLSYLPRRFLRLLQNCLLGLVHLYLDNNEERHLLLHHPHTPYALHWVLFKCKKFLWIRTIPQELFIEQVELWFTDVLVTATYSKPIYSNVSCGIFYPNIFH